MKIKKFLRGPWLWVVLAIGVMLIGSQLMTTQQFTKVDTQVGLELIETGKAKTVKIFDGDQRVDVTLITKDVEYGEQVQFYYVLGREAAVTKAVADAFKPFAEAVQATFGIATTFRHHPGAVLVPNGFNVWRRTRSNELR